MATAAARRYARAAFELATEEGRVEEWTQLLRMLREIVANPTVSAVLNNPTIPPARRMDVITAAQLQLDKELTNLARLLVEARRVDQVPAISEEFERLADEAAGRVVATVTTAVDLSPEDKEQIASELSQRLHEEVRLRVVVDPSILGGLKLQYGDHLVDATVASRLQQLRRRLADAS